MTCLLCHTDLADAPVLAYTAKPGVPSKRVVCPQCALVQVVDPPSREELATYYATQYRKDYPEPTIYLSNGASVRPDHPDYGEVVLAMHGTRALRLVRNLGLKEGDTVVEIGCGRGELLHQLGQLGIKAVGYDPDPEAVRVARMAYGVNAYVGNLDLAVLQADAHLVKWDAAVAMHVLEHDHDPIDMLRDLSRLGDKVYVEVPDVRRYADVESCFHHVHLYDFQPTTLAEVFDQAGLTVAGVEEHGDLSMWGGTQVDEFGFDGWNSVSPGWSAGYMVEHFTKLREKRDKLINLKALREWMTSAPSSGEERLVRRGLRDSQEEFQKLHRVYLEAADGILHLSKRLDEESVKLMSEHDSDPWLDGYRFGMAHMMERTSRLLTHLTNAMRLAGEL